MRIARSKIGRKDLIIPMAVVLGLVALTYTASALQNSSQHKVLFEKAKFTMETKGDLKGAIDLFEEIIKKYPNERDFAAKSLYLIGICYEKLGEQQAQQAQAAFQRIVHEYPDQTAEVNLAKEKLSLLAKPELAAVKSGQELTTSLVWQGPGMDTSGKISPDGRYLSFVDWPTGNLAVRETATGNVRRLTSKAGSPPGSDEFADWSIWAPDSENIAYAWYSYNPNLYELRTIGLDDSKPRVLFRGDYHKNFAHPWDWSPDGRYILADITKEAGISSSGLGLISVADGSIRLLSPGETELKCAKFSPDGRHIVFERPQAPNVIKKDISLISIDGRSETVLVDHPSDDSLLGWAPDGGGILFLSDRTGTWDVWMIRVVDGKPQGVPRLIKRELGRIRAMGLTRSGSLYYSTPGFEWDIFSAALDPDSGKLTDPPKKVPLLYEGQNTFPALSPDGKRLAYISERPGTRSDVLCVFSFETGETLEIQSKGVFQRFMFPSWMPDGSSLLLSGVEVTRGRGFFKVDLETGNLTEFLDFNDVFGKDQAGNVRGIRISDDARSIYYLYHGPDHSCRVMTRRLGSTDEKEICRFPLHDPSDPNRLVVSPDGKRLALALREGEDTVLEVFPAAGGEIREIHRTGQTGGLGGIVWSQDGRYIYFIEPVDPEHDQWKTELWRIPSSGGNAENLGLTSNRFVMLHFHPDGKRIFYASRTEDEQVGAIWVIKNVLPQDKARK
jgi:Tol biopolymer transport system component